MQINVSGCVVCIVLYLVLRGKSCSFYLFSIMLQCLCFHLIDSEKSCKSTLNIYRLLLLGYCQCETSFQRCWKSHCFCSNKMSTSQQQLPVALHNVWKHLHHYRGYAGSLYGNRAITFKQWYILGYVSPRINIRRFNPGLIAFTSIYLQFTLLFFHFYTTISCQADQIVFRMNYSNI